MPRYSMILKCRLRCLRVRMKEVGGGIMRNMILIEACYYWLRTRGDIKIHVIGLLTKMMRALINNEIHLLFSCFNTEKRSKWQGKKPISSTGFVIHF